MGELSQNINKVCILAAGKGTRMGFNIPKLLLPVNHKSMLSHIISWFLEGTEFVIAVGWEKEKIIDFVDLVHPEQKIKFVHVDNWDRGSGPGYSLLSCEAALSDPFYFVSSDNYLRLGGNLYPGIGPITENFIITSHLVDDHRNYLTIDGERNLTWYDKTGAGWDAFTGLAAIYDTEDFFEGLEGSTEVVEGFRNLREVHNIQDDGPYWEDIGTRAKYEYVLHKENKFGFLPKENEFLYFERNLVVKYFDDKDIIEQRAKRAKYLDGAVPPLEGKKGNFYTYKYVPGNRLSHVSPDVNVYSNFLQYCEDTIWQSKAFLVDEDEVFEKACRQFYHDKTKQRVGDYLRSRDLKDNIQMINGRVVPHVYRMLSRVPWSELTHFAVPVVFHGDPQPENVIVTEDSFCFLDWRQNFGGSVKWGDLYYDLAKLYHALIVSGEAIRGGHFTVGPKHFTFHKRSNLDMLKTMFEDHCKKQGHSLEKVRMHTALIYLNLAALYPNDYGLFLFTLGKYALNDVLEGRWTI